MPTRKPLPQAPAETEPEPKPALTERGEATRARLLETAYTLFIQKGFHATSLRDIADEAGLAVGGIYNHFKDKEQIFAAVLDAYHPYHTILPGVENVEAETVEEFFRGAGHVIYDSVSGARAQLLPLIFIELVEFQGRHFKRLAGRIAPIALKFLARLKTLKGRLRPMAPIQLITAYLSLIIGVVLTDWVLKNLALLKMIKTEKRLDGMIDIFLHGVMESE